MFLKFLKKIIYLDELDDEELPLLDELSELELVEIQKSMNIMFIFDRFLTHPLELLDLDRFLDVFSSFSFSRDFSTTIFFNWSTFSIKLI